MIIEGKYEENKKKFNMRYYDIYDGKEYVENFKQKILFYEDKLLIIEKGKTISRMFVIQGDN